VESLGRLGPCEDGCVESLLYSYCTYVEAHCRIVHVCFPRILCLGGSRMKTLKAAFEAFLANGRTDGDVKGISVLMSMMCDELYSSALSGESCEVKRIGH
jgi:hypothetical protein